MREMHYFVQNMLRVMDFGVTMMMSNSWMWDKLGSFVPIIQLNEQSLPPPKQHYYAERATEFWLQTPIAHFVHDGVLVYMSRHPFSSPTCAALHGDFGTTSTQNKQNGEKKSIKKGKK